MRWSGGTAGDDVSNRADLMRSQRRRILWLRDYLPLSLAAGGLLLLAVPLASRHWPKRGLSKTGSRS